MDDGEPLLWDEMQKYILIELNERSTDFISCTIVIRKSEIINTIFCKLKQQIRLPHEIASYITKTEAFILQTVNVKRTYEFLV